jgi:hypothetical protein
MHFGLEEGGENLLWTLSALETVHSLWTAVPTTHTPRCLSVNVLLAAACTVVGPLAKGEETPWSFARVDAGTGLCAGTADRACSLELSFS